MAGGARRSQGRFEATTRRLARKIEILIAFKQTGSQPSRHDFPMHTVYQPKDILRKTAFRAVNGLFRLQGLRMQPEMPLNARLDILWRGAEPEIQKLSNRLLRGGMTAIDIGANIGLLTRYFQRRVGREGWVFAFEPDPSIFEFAKFNNRRFANVEVIQSAVSDNEQPVVLHLNYESSASNSLFGQARSGESVTVPCTTLDAFLKKRGDLKVDLVKIDVEGAELNVLRGMRQTTARLPGLKIIIEYFPAIQNNAGIAPTAILDELRSQHFRLYVIQTNGVPASFGDADVPQSALNAYGYANLFCERER
jgi:FkbM family methyltransferase